MYIEPEEEGPDGKATVYDVEPDRKGKDADVRALPRRVRFYHGKIAARGLSSGMDYNGLKNVIVLMILPFDPFGRKRMVYTVKNKCVEEPDMEYEDGASTLFLYTKGTRGVPSDAVRQLLRYMEKSTGENAVNDDLREVHRMVEIVKLDPETTVSCVRLMEKLNRREKKGEARGEARGRKEGEAVGEARGKAEKLVTQVCKKMKLGQHLEKIASDLVEEISVIEPIYKEAGKFAPEYDPKSVMESLGKKK